MQNEILWTAAFLNERFTTIVSPLGWSFVGSLFEQLALRDPLRVMGYSDAETIPATRLWHGHPYVNVALFQIFYKVFPDALVPEDAVRYFPNGEIAMRKRAAYPRSIAQPRFLFSLAYHVCRDPLVTTPLNFLAWNRFARAHDARIRALQKKLAAATNAQQVLWTLAATHQLDRQLLHIHRWSLTYADVLYRLLTHFGAGNAQAWMSNVPNITRVVNVDLAALAECSPPPSAELLRQIKERASLPRAEQHTAHVLEKFLARHGHRAFSLDIAQPTWRDDPTQLLPLLEARDSHAAFESKTMRVPVPPALVPLIALARRYARLREDQRYAWQKSLAVTRAAYLMLGRDLAARDLIHAADEIFYATHAELERYYGMKSEPHELAETVAARKREWVMYAEKERARAENAYPLFLRGDEPLSERAHNDVEPNEWRGRGVSAGVARGAARIVEEPRALERVRAGEILIAPSTDPAWTPVFARAAAVVLERGGVLSHGAVVAREYHLPAVTAIPNILRALRDGEWVEVDGTRGLVRRVPRE